MVSSPDSSTNDTFSQGMSNRGWSYCHCHRRGSGMPLRIPLPRTRPLQSGNSTWSKSFLAVISYESVIQLHAKS